MNEHKSTEAKEDLEVGGASCKGAGEAKAGKTKGASKWAELVHSLGLPESPASHGEGLLTDDPCLATATTEEVHSDGEDL